MRSFSLLTTAALVGTVLGQSVISGTLTSATSTAPEYASGDISYNSNNSPSPISTEFTYVSGSATLTRSESVAISSAITSGNSTILVTSQESRASTVLSGSVRPSSTGISGTLSGNTTATSTAVQPVNTVPCNGHPQFCNRKYSNITHVAAHNSPYVIPKNVASNQALDVRTQLNDGIRMLTMQVHKPNNTLYLCHTNCDLLNAGTLVSYLTTVREWLDEHQYDVITILMGNYNVLAPSEFVQPIIDSGLVEYAYVPPTVPMSIDGWPTLGEMILRNKRAVIMLDYEANQAEIPWLLDEFSYVWETPFSPTDRDFPCTVDRPPQQDRNISAQRMSLANHNLNIDFAFAGVSLLVPAYNLMNETNADDGYGSAGWAVQNCTRNWNRPPTFLMVDYYNIGNFNGSVFAVAAEANNITYNRDSCCGTVSANAGFRVGMLQGLSLTIFLALGMLVF